MLKETIPCSGSSGGRLATSVLGKIVPMKKLTVEVITSKEGCANDGDFCKYCILDALYKLDDRVKELKKEKSK